MDQINACYLHSRDPEIRSQGIAAGYPTNINFKELLSQVADLFSILNKIIHKKEKSPYFDSACQLTERLGRSTIHPGIEIQIYRENLVR